MRGNNIAAIITNLAIILDMIFFTVMSFKYEGKWSGKNFKRVLKYFTFLSNEFLAIVAVFSIIFPNSFAVGIIKYIAVVAVTVTMITVLVFLGPTIGYKKVLTGHELWMHLINPLLAILLYLDFERPYVPFPLIFLGVVPVALYGILYLCKVLLVKEEKRWEDFYGFNKGGLWYLSIIIMLFGNFLICLAFYFIRLVWGL